MIWPVWKLFYLGGIIIGSWQGAPPETLRVVTVCEALESRLSYNGKPVAVLGRFTQTGEGMYLDEECALRLRTKDFTWPNAIWVEFDKQYRQEMRTAVDSNSLRDALRRIMVNTHLNREEDSWIVASGRFETSAQLEVISSADGKTIRGAGYGHLNVAPAQLLVQSRDNIQHISAAEAEQLIKAGK